MRTRAQISRDDALRRLTRVNRSLAVAAVIAAGVITDVVANTASGHTRKLVAEEPSVAPTQHRTATVARHRAAAEHRRIDAVANPPAASSSSTSSSSASGSSVSAASSAPAVVAVSGGS